MFPGTPPDPQNWGRIKPPPQTPPPYERPPSHFFRASAAAGDIIALSFFLTYLKVETGSGYAGNCHLQITRPTVQ